MYIGIKMADSDPTLGKVIHELLKAQGLETPMKRSVQDEVQRNIKLATACIDLVAGLGLDLQDDSIKGTPDRIHKMYEHEVFYGLDYKQFPKCNDFSNKYKYDEMIAVKGIDVLSYCEHHLIPFIGHAHIAYIPQTHVLGLSKFNRVVDFFARRPQVQERLTAQISLALRHILKTDDLAIVIECEHMCVRMRGVKQGGSTTVTSQLDGKFKDVPELRAEFLALTRQP